MRIVGRLLALLGSVVVIVVAAFPVYWMAVTALTPGDQVFSRTPAMLPDPSQLTKIIADLGTVPVIAWISNSAVIATGTMVLSVMLAFSAAYGLSRVRFRGRGTFGFALFVTQMLPEALVVVPFYSIFLTLGLLNGHVGLVLANVAFVMPVCVWILKGAIDTVPVELEESARIDGCGPIRMQVRIILPLVSPSVAAAGVIAFFHGWDEYLFAATFISDRSRWPAAVGLASFFGDFGSPVNQVMAVAVVFTLPAVVFLMLAQRRMVSGLTAGAVKG